MKLVYWPCKLKVIPCLIVEIVFSSALVFLILQIYFLLWHTYILSEVMTYAIVYFSGILRYTAM